MALRLRRGSEADRQTETFAEGELIYVTDTKKLYVGDGITLGGVLVTASSVGSPAQLTQDLDLNGYNISGNGTISATAFVGDGSGLTGITGGGGEGIVEGQTYFIDIVGDVFGADSSLLVDSVTNRFTGDLTGNVTGNVTGDLTGNVTGSLTGAQVQVSNVIGTGDVNFIRAGNNNMILKATETTFQNVPINSLAGIQGTLTGNVIGNVTGNLTGSVDGDLVGSVFSDDSTGVLVDGTIGKLTGDVLNSIVQTEQFKLYAPIGESALLESKKTDTALTFDTGTTISTDRAVYTDATGDGVAWTSVHYTDRTVSYVGDVVSANAVSHSTVGVNIGSSADATQKLEVAGNIKIDAGSLMFSDSRFYTDVLTPADGELMFDANVGKLYLYSNGFGEWQELLSVSVGGGLLSTNAAIIPASFDEATIATVGEDSSTYDGALLYNSDADRVQFFQAGSWVKLPNNGTTIGEVLKWNGTEWSAALDTGGVVPGSNADFLDGFDGTYYLDYGNFANTPFVPADTGDLTNGAGFITASSADILTNKSGAISQWTNDSGYITASSADTLTNKSGNISQWTNNSGYITASSADTLTNKSGNISQWTNDSGYITTVAFADVTGKPTTLAGYGITDAATSAQGALADTAVQPAALGSFTFTGTILDTSDSSGITVTPALTVQSDVIVENDLVVNNKITANTVYAERFETATTGTPTIEAATNLDLTAGNAVRITSSVLRLASFTTAERDALAAQNGDIIYNTTLNKFQGYENGAWVNLI